MASFGAVRINGPLGPDFYQRAASIGIARLREETLEQHLWIDTSAGLSFYEKSIEAAKAASALSSFEGTTYALVGQSLVDCYAVIEFQAGRSIRQLTYNRDEGGWDEAQGTPRPWEIEFHFALPLAEFIDLLDEDWTDEEIERARQAYQQKELSMLPRLPRASYRQLIAFAEKLGFDFDVGPHAVYRKPGFFQRLFRR